MDEPISKLDSRSPDEIIELFGELNKHSGLTVFVIRDGQLIGDDFAMSSRRSEEA